MAYHLPVQDDIWILRGGGSNLSVAIGDTSNSGMDVSDEGEDEAGGAIMANIPLGFPDGGSVMSFLQICSQFICEVCVGVVLVPRTPCCQVDW